MKDKEYAPNELGLYHTSYSPRVLNREIDGDGRLTGHYAEFQSDKDVCMGLVHIASTVLGVRLQFKLSSTVNASRLDKGYILVPSSHPDKILATKHTLAHVYFSSDLVHAEARILGALEGLLIPRGGTKRLVERYMIFVHVLEDLRIHALWGAVYPGDGRNLSGWYTSVIAPDMLRDAVSANGEDISDLTSYLLLEAVGMSPISSKWEKYSEDVLNAVKATAFNTFSVLVSVCICLLKKIIQDLADEEPNKGGGNEWVTPASSPVDDAVESLSRQIRRPYECVNPNAGLAKNKYSVKAVAPDVPDPLDMEQAIRDGRDAQGESLRRLQADVLSALCQSVRREDTKTRIVIVPAHSLARPSTCDAGTVDRLRRQFTRIRDHKRTRLADSGYSVDVSRYIHNKIAGTSSPMYRRALRGSGFRMTLVIDLSGSMSTSIGDVDRLYRLLNESMRFPFVQLSVIGFNSTSSRTTIYKFPENAQSIISTSSRPFGGTPTHRALSSVYEAVGRGTGRSYVFLLTDGKPVHKNAAGNAVGPTMSRALVSRAVREGNRRNVRTYCLAIGKDVSSDEHLEFMFGHNKWKHIGGDTLCEDAFSLVRDKFTKFLRR